MALSPALPSAIARHAVDHWAALETGGVIRSAEAWARNNHARQRRPRWDITPHNR